MSAMTLCVATCVLLSCFYLQLGRVVCDPSAQMCDGQASSTASHALLQFAQRGAKVSIPSPLDGHEEFKEDVGIKAVELGSSATPGRLVSAKTVDCEAQARACSGDPNCQCDTVCPCAQKPSAEVMPEEVIEEEEEPEEAAAVQPSGTGCSPTCKYKCEEAACDQACSPICSQPRCETRCRKNTKGCGLICNQPECHTTCPARQCPTKECPACTTTCSKPVCRLQCSQKQDCKSVCAHPNCEWKCEKKSCPPPKCKLQCTAPKHCNMQGAGKDLPALEPGEVSVKSFIAPVRSTRLSSNQTYEAEQEEEEEDEGDDEVKTTTMPAQPLASNLELSVKEDFMESDGNLQHRMVTLPVLAQMDNQ
eukprot:gnl/TRDRNA2_/TRDRNA2_168056_c0_seq1.p1 gnl/TRDRNA2_/TRDRNA2_168056_c0~~gnl/TRDRNA2_/TRDRNA2_168056_c0_seq1.p1  ORF type:complete len:363 (-),score=67.41 gnl/TRDRNA2_/TRDRNA2_168056_c0_seq1:313-1401(-)